MPAPTDNQNATKHGGAAGIADLTSGKDFTTPLAISQQADVIAELETAGLESIVERAAVRLQTVSDLFYAAIQAASQRNDIEAVDTYSQRFGWLQSKALLAWQQVKANRKAAGKALDGVLKDYANDTSK